MRNTKAILMSILMIGVVATAVGATIADFSDIEISQDNYFETGALDLKVSDYMGNEYQDPDVPAFFQVSDAWPCCDKSIFLDLENYGQGWQVMPWVYMHIKNLECYYVEPKNVKAWIMCEQGECVEVEPGTPGAKPVNEPEYVAECGGIAGEDEDGNPVVVPGIGCCYGEDCQLAKHIDIHISAAGPYSEDEKPPTSTDVPDGDWWVVDLSEYDKNGDGVIKMDEIECEELELGELDNNHGMWVHIWLHLQDIDEDDLDLHYFPEDSKFDHWPTNALQKDGLEFDIAFELLQNRYVD